MPNDGERVAAKAAHIASQNAAALNRIELRRTRLPLEADLRENPSLSRIGKKRNLSFRLFLCESEPDISGLNEEARSGQRGHHDDCAHHSSGDRTAIRNRQD